MSSLPSTDLCTNMVEQQIRPWNVLDDRVLELYYEVPRDMFALAGHASLAYSDIQLPCGEGQVMLEPKLEARMLQELAPKPSERILHIGTGSGFFAALLSRLAGQVTTVDINPQLAQAAAERFSKHSLSNIETLTGNAFGELDAQGKYDGIVLTGSTPSMPENLFARFGANRIVGIVGSPPIATLVRAVQLEQSFNIQSFVETWAPPLVEAPRPSRFVF